MSQIDLGAWDLNPDLALEDWEKFPATVIDSHGLPVDFSGNEVRFNTAHKNASFDFSVHAISNKWLTYALKRHLIYRVSKVSPVESHNTIRLNVWCLKRAPSWNELAGASTLSRHSTALNRVMSEVAALLQKDGTLYNFFRLREWYCWCADYLPEFGFDSDEAYKWQLIKIPGNEKGVAVRTEDAGGGPLQDAEFILLRRGIKNDTSAKFEHLRERVAVLLGLVYGRNPANYVQLRCRDLINLTAGTGIDTWVLMIPRIKKRGRPRSDFKQEYVSPELASLLLELIAHRSPQWKGEDLDRPLLMRDSPRAALIGTAMEEWAWHLTSSEFTYLIQQAISRYGIVSPRTGELLEVTTRRLRYTFATNRVREGISRVDLAEALDHTDLQNVMVYFDSKSTIVERLDVAAAKVIAPQLALFTGSVMPSAGVHPAKIIRIEPEIAEARGMLSELGDLGKCGEDEICTWFPPYSCYLCQKFKPFDDSLIIHTLVLEHLVTRRERLLRGFLNDSRIAVQLDDVIYACAHVIVILESAIQQMEPVEHAA